MIGSGVEYEIGMAVGSGVGVGVWDSDGLSVRNTPMRTSAMPAAINHIASMLFTYVSEPNLFERYFRQVWVANVFPLNVSLASSPCL